MAFENDDKYSFFTIFSLLIAINLVYISIQLFFLKKVKELEDKPTEEAIAKLDKEREEFIKAKAEINHKLKDFKLEMSQKLTIIRKLIENLKDSKDVNENRKLFITALKNTLKPKSFIIFFYDKESNSFKKLYDESVEMSEIKSSTLLKWTIERAFNFPANINILDKHTIDKNPEFSKIKDDNLPEIFIPIKDKNILLGFIIIYKTEESLTNSENKTIAHLLSEIASFLRKFELI
jgi:transcriptional regulator with GAF, ATPase, and Fis domain